MKPILRKELRALMRERRGFFFPVLYALLLAAFAGLQFVGTRAAGVDPVALGRTLATTVVAIQSIAVLLFAPIIGASMIAGERERGTWARLVSSSVSREGIVLGKLCACCLYLLLLMSISFPIAALSLLFGGIDFPILAGLYLTHILIAACLASLGVAVSTGFSRTWAASFLALAIAFTLAAGLPVAAIAIGAALRSPIPGSVYAASGAVQTQLIERVLSWLNPMYSVTLLFSGSNATRLDWWTNYAAMLVLGGAFLGFAVLRVRRGA